MSVLSDGTILDRLELHADDPQRIAIIPFDRTALQPASVDLRLNDTVLYNGQKLILTPAVPILIAPHGTALVSTYEHIVTPTDCVSRVEGKSSIGRQFVVIHCTAGWGDPGFMGRFTLEVVNHSPHNFFALTYRMRICQITFLALDKPALTPYSGRYQHDDDTQDTKPPREPI